jgi:hypothetical protein
VARAKAAKAARNKQRWVVKKKIIGLSRTLRDTQKEAAKVLKNSELTGLDHDANYWIAYFSRVEGANRSKKSNKTEGKS